MVFTKQSLITAFLSAAKPQFVWWGKAIAVVLPSAYITLHKLSNWAVKI